MLLPTSKNEAFLYIDQRRRRLIHVLYISESHTAEMGQLFWYGGMRSKNFYLVRLFLTQLVNIRQP